MVVVDKSGASHEVELVLELIWEVFWVAEGLFEELFVNTFIGAFFKHVRADVNTNGVFESVLMQILADKASSASQINDIRFLGVPVVALGVPGNVVCHIFWVWVAHSGVHSLVIGGNMIKMHLSVFFVIFVAFFKHLDMFIGKWCD